MNRNADRPAGRGWPGALSAHAWGSATLLLVAAALCWSLNPIVGRAVRGLISPVALGFWRWAVALIAVVAFAWPHLRADAPLIRRHWKILVALGLIGIGVFAAIVYWALRHTTALNNLMMQSAMPPMILALSALLFRDRITPGQIAGTLLSLGGLLAILSRGRLDNILAMEFNRGDAASLVAVFLYSLYSAMLRKKPPIHPLSLLAVLFAVGALFLAIPYAIELARGVRMVGRPETILAILYVGIFPSLLSYFFFNRSVELIGAARAGIFMNLPPVFGVGLAIILLGEQFELFHLYGATLVALGIFCATRGGKDRPAAAIESPAP